ncbi:MAG: type II toxin-antitoxin system RelE family toxin [Mycobacteriales bacterium]
MSHAIEWKPSARKELRGIDVSARRRILATVDQLAEDPRPAGSVTLTGSPGWRRIRIGGYRVVYEVRDEAHVVLVLRVGPRGSVYQHLT